MPLPRLWHTVAAAALFASVSVTGPAAAQSPAPGADPATTVVASVGDSEITLAELLRYYAQLPAQYRQVPFQQIYMPLLDRLIETRLIADAARSSELGEREDVQTRMKAAADVAAEAAAQGVLTETYLSETIAALVTEDALRARYEERVAGVAAGEEAKARHILLESEEDARAVIADLDAGADFITLAEERSTGPSAPQGGDLGWFQAAQMVPEFSEAAFALEPGTYTKDPVQSQFGWHVILLEDKRSLDAPTFEDLEETLVDELSEELLRQHLADLREGATIERFGPDGTPLPGSTSQ